MTLPPLGVLLYDHSITLGMHSPQRASYIFIAFRYLSLILLFVVMIFELWDALPKAHASLEISCKFIWIMEYVALAIVIIIVNVLMSLRVYAIFRRDKRMLYVLLVYLVAAVTLALVDLVFSFWIGVSPVPPSEEIAVEDYKPGVAPRCPMPVPRTLTTNPRGWPSAQRLAILWGVVVGFDFTVFAMTVYKTFGAICEPHMPLTHILLRDGRRTTSMFNLASVVTYLAHYGGIFVSIGSSVSVVLVSRMMLHLREEASARSDSDNEGIRLATISWARTNLSRTQQGSATSASELLHDERTEERA
ncbi:hypothetical protein GGG16DRAFT_99987 [Schizophyllum commune]